jgi:hypothetical protein
MRTGEPEDALLTLDAQADFVADAFTYGERPRCGRGQLQLVLVPQKLFGDVVPPDL